jgi:hypothetical protein
MLVHQFKLALLLVSYAAEPATDWSLFDETNICVLTQR